MKKDEQTDNLTGIYDYSLNHTISPFTKYTISQLKDTTTINGNLGLYGNRLHYLSLYTLLKLNTKEDNMSYNLKTHLRYHFSNHTMLSAGIEEFEHTKESKPNYVSFCLLHGHGLENGLKFYGGLYTGYLIQEKMIKFQQLMISFKNSSFNSLLNFTMNNNRSNQSSLPDKDSNEKATGFDKSLSLKIHNKLSDNITIGGDIDFNINSYSLSNRLFTNYQLNQDTLLKSKWEDNDRSVTLTMNHNFRGLLRFGVSGKYILVRHDPNKCKFPMPLIKTKYGLYLEVNETLI